MSTRRCERRRRLTEVVRVHEPVDELRRSGRRRVVQRGPLSSKLERLVLPGLRTNGISKRVGSSERKTHHERHRVDDSGLDDLGAREDSPGDSVGSASGVGAKVA